MLNPALSSADNVHIYVIWVSLLDNKLFQLLKQKGLKKYVIREDKAAEVSDLETIHTEKGLCGIPRN